MTRNVYKHLSALSDRRSGRDRLAKVATTDAAAIILKGALGESYQRRAVDRPYTRYSIGAMQAVDPNYTRISIETAERVGNQLLKGLTAAGFSVEFRLQGSVPLDTHIRGVSDVDLLNIDKSFFTYHRNGVSSLAGLYGTGTSTTNSLTVLATLRNASEQILENAYPAATVDKSGGKAINVFGGSLARPVDVVPSHWFDTAAYQASRQEHDRGVEILDKKIPKVIENFPFLHIERINDRDGLAAGGIKKAIRLCKNVKSDAEEDGSSIALPSFDIASTMYHANMQALILGGVFELSVLAETQRHLDWLTMNEAEAQKLLVPDGSRAIFDTRAKLDALRTLSLEMDDLLREVAKEQSPALAFDGKPSLWQSREAVATVVVPDS